MLQQFLGRQWWISWPKLEKKKKKWENMNYATLNTSNPVTFLLHCKARWHFCLHSFVSYVHCKCVNTASKPYHKASQGSGTNQWTRADPELSWYNELYFVGGMCSNCSSERGPEDQENTSGRGELWHPRHVRISPEEHFQALNWLRQRLDSVLYLSNYITFKTAGVILKKKIIYDTFQNYHLCPKWWAVNQMPTEMEECA